LSVPDPATDQKTEPAPAAQAAAEVSWERSAAAGSETAAQVATPRRGFREWLWEGQALAQISRAVPELDAQQRERIQRARAALELADRTLNPVDELRAGKGTPLAFMLYREAICWALLAHDGQLEAADHAGALRAVPRQLLLDAAGGEAGLAELEAVVAKSSAEIWQATEEVQEADARKLQSFAKTLLRRYTEPELRLAGVLLRRALRVAALLALLGLLIGAVALYFVNRTPAPDLAAGRPWKASSALAQCNPREHECAGVRTDIFFCTLEEQNPWMEIDLGKAVEFSRVEVRNRTDCCEERALPLAIEVSEDGKKWKEVARKTELFTQWNATFDRVRARYVRTRALSRTFLHLEQVSVREH